MKTKLLSMLLISCFCLLVPFGMMGQNTPELVQNIAIPELSELRADRHFETIGNTTYFVGSDDSNGTELWRTDGSPDGTYLVKDIAEGTMSSFPRELAASGNTLFFVAYDNESATSLWKTDGTEAGTKIVADIPIDNVNDISLLTGIGNNKILFRVQTDNNGLEPWISDGSEAGTFQLKDINPGQSSSFPNDFILFNGDIYFSASNTSSGIEIWKSDGTEAGTQMLKDIFPGGNSSGGSHYLTLFNGELYFFADNGVVGRELWKSDGTEAGTQLVKDIYNGSTGSGYGVPTIFKNKLYFPANDLENGIEIWASDGTSNGTQRVSNINPGAEDGLRFNAYFVGNDNYLLFKGVSSTNDEELWRTDGTSGGTQLVKDIDPSNSSRPVLLFEINGKIVFSTIRSTPAIVNEVWITDGTEAGTEFITEGYNNGLDFAINNGKSFFQIDNAGDAYIYETDGSLSGTQKLQYLPRGKFTGSYPSPLQPFGNDFLFFAKDANSGYELWKTDGNSNTQLVKDTGTKASSSTSNDKENVIIGNKIYYTGKDNAGQDKIFSSDGTEIGTQSISDNWFTSSFLLGGSLVSSNNDLYFNASIDGSSFNIYKYSIGASQPDLVLVSNNYFNSVKLVATSGKVYVLDGTPISTGPNSSVAISIIEIEGINHSTFAFLGLAGRYNPVYGSINKINDKLFHTRTNISSQTLFYDNVEIYDIIPNFGSISETPIHSNDRLFWASSNNQTQPGLSEDLLKHENGTTSIIKSFPDGITPYNLTDVDGTIFFVAEEGSGNLELWKSNGTEVGTELVKDILPGSESSNPENLISHNGKLYFSANDGNSMAIWVSDGTFAGTHKVGDFPNNDQANLENFIAKGDELFFSANDGQIGQELWKIDLQTIQASGPDAELVISANELNPPTYTNTTITLNLSNTGDSPLTGLTVGLPVPAGLAFVSQNVGTGSYSNWSGEWNVGNLAAGETATMDLTLFTLTDQQIDIFAEVATQNESEVDSAPGNGNSSNPNEDDEALVSLNASGTPCSFGFIAVSVGSCNDNGTSDTADDYYTFAINPTGSNLAATYDLVGQRPNGPNFFINDLPYGQVYLSGNQLTNDGDISIEIKDGNGVCVETLTINAPASCGPTSDPELSISFIQSGSISTFPAEPFEIEIQTENNGTGGTAFFKTAYYLSSDFALDNNDQLLFQTADVLDAGAAEVNMEFLTLDASTTSGVYYLIAKIDDEDVYAEVDENNNLDRQRIVVWNPIQNECEEFYTEVDEVVCTSLNGLGFYETIARNGNNYTSTVVDEDGNELSSGAPINYNDDVVNVVNEKIEKKDRNGGIIYSIDLPAAVLNTYNTIRDADELIGGSTGYVLSASIGTDPYAVFLDDNLNIISQTALLENFPGPVVATEDGGAMIGTYRSPPTSPQGSTLFSQIHKVSSSNNLEYDFPLSTAISGAKRLPCGNNRVSFTGGLFRAGGGSSRNDSHTFEIEDLGNSTYKLLSFKISGYASFTPISQFYTYLNVYQDDGTTLKYSYFSEPEVPNLGNTAVLYYRLEKLDVNDNPIITKELEEIDFQFANVNSIYQLANDQFIVLGRKHNRLWYFQPECNGTPVATCDDNLLSNPGYESSTNFPSGWYSLGGTSITNDANTGGNALLISGNTTGGILQNLPGIAGETYTLKAQVKRTAAANEGTGNYISLKFLSATWQPLETLVDIVPAGNDFTEYSRSYTAPAGTAYVEAKAYKDNGDFEMIVDDWCLVQEGGSPCDNDNVPPVITSCPDDITVYTTGTSAVVNWTPATFTDNCGIENITGLPYQPGDAFPIGNYSLGVTAIDLSGNSTSCTFLVKVIQQSGSQPDLTLSQLNFPTVATTNSTILFNADLANIDVGDANGNFNIKSYLSTDQILSSDDIQDGIIPTGNLAGNTSVNDVAGALFVPSSLTPGDYYLLLVVDADNQIAESNENNNLLVSSSAIIISEINNSGTDLNLSASSDISTIEAWQSFSITLHLTNEGTSPANNVVLDFPKPDGAVFQGGNEYTASQGTYNSYDPQEWNVGSIPAGSTATITFNLFSTQGNSPLIAYSQVLSMDENDIDSSPGNGTCCTANEDDEAALMIPTSITTNAQTRQVAKNNQLHLELAKIYPNPATDEIQIVVQTPTVKNTIVQVYNSIGQLVIANNVNLEEGLNQLSLDISWLDSGMYFIHLPEGHAKKNQLRFVKERN